MFINENSKSINRSQKYFSKMLKENRLEFRIRDIANITFEEFLLLLKIGDLEGFMSRIVKRSEFHYAQNLTLSDLHKEITTKNPQLLKYPIVTDLRRKVISGYREEGARIFISKEYRSAQSKLYTMASLPDIIQREFES